MRYFILFCVAGCLSGAGEVLAESSAASPDCEAIKTTLIPYQIKLIKEHSVWREFHTIQIARGTQESETGFSEVTTSKPYKRKFNFRNGLVATSDTQYSRGNQHTRIAHSTFEYDDLGPKPMDFRTDQTFILTEKWEWFDDKTGERSMDVSYKYLKSEPVTIGDCIFIADLGEQTYIDKKTGNSRGKTFMWHFPDLRLTVGNPSPDITFQSISTTFEPIEFAEPNWPPAPSKADDH